MLPIIPELVIMHEDEVEALDYSRLTTVLVKAIQEQTQIITQQANTIQSLESSVSDLQQTLEQVLNRLTALEG
jgi:hypothetical protein